MSHVSSRLVLSANYIDWLGFWVPIFSGTMNHSIYYYRTVARVTKILTSCTILLETRWSYMDLVSCCRPLPTKTVILFCTGTKPDLQLMVSVGSPLFLSTDAWYIICQTYYSNLSACFDPFLLLRWDEPARVLDLCSEWANLRRKRVFDGRWTPEEKIIPGELAVW